MTKQEAAIILAVNSGVRLCDIVKKEIKVGKEKRSQIKGQRDYLGGKMQYL